MDFDLLTVRLNSRCRVVQTRGTGTLVSKVMTEVRPGKNVAWTAPSGLPTRLAWVPYKSRINPWHIGRHALEWLLANYTDPAIEHHLGGVVGEQLSHALGSLAQPLIARIESDMCHGSPQHTGAMSLAHASSYAELTSHMPHWSSHTYGTPEAPLLLDEIEQIRLRMMREIGEAPDLIVGHPTMRARLMSASCSFVGNEACPPDRIALLRAEYLRLVYLDATARTLNPGSMICRYEVIDDLDAGTKSIMASTYARLVFLRPDTTALVYVVPPAPPPWAPREETVD